jgi:hypothetical protein
MRSVWLLALAALGCRNILGIEEPIRVPDADTSVTCMTWHPQGFDPCALGPPMPALHLKAGQYLYETTGTTTMAGGRLSAILPDNTLRVLLQSALAITQPDNSTVAVLSVDSLTVDAGATISVMGVQPFLLVAWSTMAIDGRIDAGSRVPMAGVPHIGAGANEACGTSAGSFGSMGGATGGSGGGGGGGLQGAGGAGAHGVAASGGMGGGTVVPLVIRGGCPGGTSGMAGMSATPPASPSSQALGGAGGGAIRLVAHDSITIEGSVSASGAGGSGAPLNSACGGGGGGSGGYVALEAPAVAIGANGAVAANGGGGGGGGGTLDAGNDGADGGIDLQAAPGGVVSSKGCGLPGGVGSAAGQLDGSDGTGAITGGCGGGGGGGGGAGFITIASAGFTAQGSAKISPPAMMQ